MRNKYGELKLFISTDVGEDILDYLTADELNELQQFVKSNCRVWNGTRILDKKLIIVLFEDTKQRTFVFDNYYSPDSSYLVFNVTQASDDDSTIDNANITMNFNANGTISDAIYNHTEIVLPE